MAGIGVGKFAYEYPLWQANYFREKMSVATNDIFLADMSFYAFNEWLQLLIEGGIFSFIFFAGFIIFTLSKGIQQIENRKNSVFVLIITGIVLATFFSYPLHNPTIFFLLTLSCAYINQLEASDSRISFFSSTFFKSIKVIVGILLFVYFISQYMALGWWRQAKKNIIVNEESALKYYTKAYPLLKHKGEFLFNNGAQYFEMGIYDKAGYLFGESKRLFSHYSLFIYKGANHQKRKEFNEAEACFSMAEKMIPSRIYPKSLLAKLFWEQGDTVKSFQKAKEVVLFKTKVDGRSTDSIKTEMKKLLHYERQ